MMKAAVAAALVVVQAELALELLVVEWLIVEWPEGHEHPSDYWLSNLPTSTDPEQLARLARLRWMIERARTGCSGSSRAGC
jgi:hypothetical protein